LTVPKKITLIRSIWVACCLQAALPLAGYCQHLPDKVIFIDVRKMPLAQVLDSIGRLARFDFSYNSSILPGDSLVTVTLRQVTVRTALDKLLGPGYTYAETGKYLILLRAMDRQGSGEGSYEVTGEVLDRNTGRGIDHATVYVKEQLQSTLTDGQGSFKLRLRIRSATPVITASKEWYADTDIVIHAGYDQSLHIEVRPVIPDSLSPVFVSSSGVERSGWGRFFLSSRQRMQGLNLSHFFTSSSAQVSLVPWVGTHGKLSGQVTNTYSLNIIGGYGAGVNGIELGGVFNIDKKNVRSLQMAGVVNVAGGSVSGLQAAGLINIVMDSLRGLQLAGLGNRVGGNVTGVQAAGYMNVCKDTLRGVQISCLQNRARVLRGVQIGLLNVADTSMGYSIGLISIVKHGGIHQLSLSASELTGLMAEYRLGNPRLNSILLVSYDPWSQQKIFSWGYGIGKEFMLTKRWGLYGEVTEEQVYKSNWEGLGVIAKAEPLLTFQAGRKLQFFVGPSFSLYHNPSKQKFDTHQLYISHSDILIASLGQNIHAMAGIRAGITIF
jgi:hypothetical protein